MLQLPTDGGNFQRPGAKEVKGNRLPVARAGVHRTPQKDYKHVVLIINGGSHSIAISIQQLSQLGVTGTSAGHLLVLRKKCFPKSSEQRPF